MEFISVLMVFIGLIAVFAGTYELTKKTVVGRNVRASKPEQIRKFSEIDGATYLGEGVLVIVLAFSDYLPFVSTVPGKTVIVVLIVTLVIFNYIMARKTLDNFTD